MLGERCPTATLPPLHQTKQNHCSLHCFYTPPHSLPPGRGNSPSSCNILPAPAHLFRHATWYDTTSLCTIYIIYNPVIFLFRAAWFETFRSTLKSFTQLQSRKLRRCVPRAWRHRLILDVELMPRAAASYFFPHPQQPLAVHVQELPPPHLHPDLPIAKHIKREHKGGTTTR